ncbi:hypothetical protein MNBD_GAMMA09-2528 [hydrothermal vent metagenome]|uniref:Uncharacterized protein n=1 Tax=hydrothermal vent metagenome TaxID=652676 RepID=A0A3B0Y2F3_9ZZZZ
MKKHYKLLFSLLIVTGLSINNEGFAGNINKHANAALHHVSLKKHRPIKNIEKGNHHNIKHTRLKRDVTIATAHVLIADHYTVHRHSPQSKKHLQVRKKHTRRH